MVLLGDEAQVEARFGPFGDSANLDAHSIELLGDVGHAESLFGPFRDSVSIGAR
jgi:hypothetical protein